VNGHTATKVRERAPGGTGIVAIWTLLPAIPGLAVFTSRVWGTGPYSSLWAVLMTISGGIAVRGVWEVTRARRDLVRWAVGAVALAYTWLMAATFVPGPGGRPVGPLSALLGVWILLATPLCLTLTVRILPSVRGAAGDGAGGGELDGVVTALQDARVGTPQVTGPRVSATVTMPAGGDIADVQRQQRQVASALDVDPSRVRVAPVPGASPRHGRLDVVVVDQLRDGVPWMPLAAPGGPVSAPIILGTYEDGVPAGLWLVGDDAAGRNAAGIIALVAMKGAGKTVLMRRFVGEYLSRKASERDFWLADPRKFGQLPAWVRDAADRSARNEAECAALLDDVMDQASERAAWLGARGLEQWQDGCGLPFLLVWIDEAAGLGDAAERLVDVAETVRSTGICVVVAYQRFTGDRVPTSAREQISTVICLGVKASAEAGRVLSDATMAAGADPSVWADRYPGMAYLEAAGVDEERWAVPWRVCRGEDAAIAAELAPYLRDTAVSDAGRTADGTQEEGEAVDPDDDPRVPIEALDPPPHAFGRPGAARPATERAVAMVREMAVRLCGTAGSDGVIAPADFGEVLVAVGRSPAWLTEQLRVLSAPGPDQVLVRLESRGRYAPARREPVADHAG